MDADHKKQATEEINVKKFFLACLVHWHENKLQWQCPYFLHAQLHDRGGRPVCMVKSALVSQSWGSREE